MIMRASASADGSLKYISGTKAGVAATSAHRMRPAKDLVFIVTMIVGVWPRLAPGHTTWNLLSETVSGSTGKGSDSDTSFEPTNHDQADYCTLGQHSQCCKTAF